MKTTALNPAPVDLTKQITQKILDMPVESIVLAGRPAGGTDVLIRTGVDGWISTCRKFEVGSNGQKYLHRTEVRKWVRLHLERNPDCRFILIEEEK